MPNFIKQDTVAIISAPFSGGQAKGGVDQGPSHLLKAGLESQIKGLNWKTVIEEPSFSQFHSNKSHPLGIKNAYTVSDVTKVISDLVFKHASSGSLPLTIGGDHSLALGTIHGSARVYPNIGVIWDINTPQTTTSGNLHGCPVSFLTGLAGKVEGFEWLGEPCLLLDRIVYIGLRDLDPAEKRIIKENKIRAFTMYDVDKHGIGKVVEMALEFLGDSPIHLTFDVDALDPSEAPATGTPVRGGLTFREGHFICERIYESGNVVAVDIMEVNPCIGGEAGKEQTVRVGCSLARASLGETLL